ncbi:MAG: DUF1329 domain-containing protein [Desulfobacterales bacterium]
MMKNVMMKRFFFLVILLAVWIHGGSSVICASEPKPGDVISSSNIDQYEDYFPPYIARFIKDGWGFVKPVTIHVGEPKLLPTGKVFKKATEQNAGKVKLSPDGLLEGYPDLGLPFPDPKEPDLALKIIWNRYYAWFVDDWSMPGGTYHTFSQRSGGPVAHAQASYDCLRFSNRTMVPPVPELDNPNQLFWSTLLDSETPPNRGMATLTWRYKDPVKEDDMWTYIPTMRRTLRMVSSERANPIRGTPLTWDDIFGFDGKIPNFNYAYVGEKKTLVLSNHQRWVHDLPGKEWNHPIVFGPEEPWELKNTYLIEITPKDPRYPMSKRVVWVIDENWKINNAAIYDKNGEFWKGYFQSQKHTVVDAGDGKENYAFTMSLGITDFKTQYWTLGMFDSLLLNRGLQTGMFTPTALGRD